MDYIRVSLWAALFVAGWLLLQQWSDFTKAQNIESNSQLEYSFSEEKRILDTQILPVESTYPNPEIIREINNEDVPDFTAAQKTLVGMQQVSNQPVSQSKASTIKVTTDVFNIEISPVGGDITHLSLAKYPVSIEQKNLPFTLLNDRKFTFVAQSGMVRLNGPELSSTKSHYTSEFSHYKLDDNDHLDVTLRSVSVDGVITLKTYTFFKSNYLIEVNHTIHNNSDSSWQGVFYGQLKRDASEDPSASGNQFAMNTFLGAAISTEEKPFEKYDFDDIEESPVKLSVKDGWLGFIQHYFLTAWIPEKGSEYLYETRSRAGSYYVSFKSQTPLDIAAGKTAQLNTRLYAGPKDQQFLDHIEGVKHLSLSVDYGILWFIAQPLFQLLIWLYENIASNWGIAIILLTMMVKAAFYWPSKKSFESMANMRRVQPRMTEVKERFGDDRQKFSQAMMELYKKEKINPLGGCLPIVIQMPVFLSLYWVLMESVELRQAIFIPGWINDLSIHDPYFILPIIMAASMYVQQLLNPTPPDPMQAKVMKMMPLIFGVFFLFFPAGLVLYWVVNNLLSITQQWFITKRIEAS